MKNLIASLALAAAASGLGSGCAPLGQSVAAAHAKGRYSSAASNQLEVSADEIDKLRDAYFALEVPRAFSLNEANHAAAEAELRAKGLFTPSASAELRQKYASDDAALRRGIADEKARWSRLSRKVRGGAVAIDTLIETDRFEADAHRRLDATNQQIAGDVLAHLEVTAGEVAAKRRAIQELERQERELALQREMFAFEQEKAGHGGEAPLAPPPASDPSGD